MADDSTTKPLSESPDFVPEQLLVEQLNVPVKKMRGIRPEGVRVDGPNGVFWPLADATALAESMGATLTLPDKKNAPTGGVEELTVVSCSVRGGNHFPNPRVIQARRKNGQLVFVTVSNPVRFQPYWTYPPARLKAQGPGKIPMVIQAMPPNGGLNWNLVGNEPSAQR